MTPCSWENSIAFCHCGCPMAYYWALLLVVIFWDSFGGEWSTLKKDIGTIGEKNKFMDGTNRDNIRPGIQVSIVQKQDQRTGRLTEGAVADILTNSANHPHGIKVRLETGEVGRVQIIHS